MKKKFWSGFLTGGLFFALFALFVVPYIGLFNMSAKGGTGILDWWGHVNYVNSLRWYAPEEKIPPTAQASAASKSYKEMCLRCHGAPDVKSYDWADRMQPTPPKVWITTEKMEDGEIFYVIKNGIKMTGMPYWSKGHTDEEIWTLVAYIRQMEKISESEKEEFRQYLKSSSGHHH